LHKYRECGLETVYLANGYAEARGESGVSVDDVEGLHRAIADELVFRKVEDLTGREFRFVREFLELSQRKVGDIAGVQAQTVALWEKRGDANVPRSADRWLRAIYRERVNQNAELVAAAQRLRELANETRPHAINVRLDEARGTWTREAA